VTSEEIDQAIAARFAEWADQLKQQQGVPAVLVGVRAADGKIMVATAVDVDDDGARELCLAVAAAIDAARTIPASEAPPPAAKGGTDADPRA
jgi:hypothetical protein